MRPVVCMITDGSLRLGGPVDVLLARIDAAAGSGVHIVQIRERALDDGTLLQVVRQCLEAVRGTRTRVIVNDRVDIALAEGAHGVHLTGDSFSAQRVRTIAPANFLVGRSIHRPDDAAAAGRSADYLMFGTVFETPSKPGRAPAGCAALAAAVRATPVPILAVGGVSEHTAADVARSGAAGIAAIGLFTRGEIPSAVARVVGAFDLPMTGS